jgi:hypothetical protein
MDSGYRLVGEYLRSMHESLGSILSPANKRKQTNNNKPNVLLSRF